MRVPRAAGYLTVLALVWCADARGGRYYLWHELAACAWLDPTIITKVRQVDLARFTRMFVDLMAATAAERPAPPR